MHYYLLRLLMKTAMRLYFGRVHRHGLAQLDNGRPLLILANHTNGFMDAMIVGAVLKRKVYFFTRGDVFAHKWADKMLRSIGMLPVYRLKDGKDKLQHNDSSNDEALKILASGGAVLIFAEGRSDIAKMIKPLKKGPFRLAVNAADSLNESPAILPLGINYIDPQKAFTPLYLCAGAPLETGIGRGAEEAEKNKAALLLLRKTEADFKQLAWHTDAPSDQPLINVLLSLQQTEHPSFSKTLRLTEKFAGAAHTPLQEKAARYLQLQQQFSILPDYLPENKLSSSICIAALLVIPALAGFLFHYTPVKISSQITVAKVTEADMKASVFLALSVASILCWYLVTCIILLLLFPVLPAFSAISSLALCGVIYLKLFLPAWRSVSCFFKRKCIKKTHPHEWDEFISLRNELVALVKA